MSTRKKDPFMRAEERAQAARALRAHLDGSDRLPAEYLDRQVLPHLTKRQVLEIALDLDRLRA